MTNSALQRIGQEEGQLIRNSSGTYEVQYYLIGHLRNVRQVLKEDGTVLQETKCYAFGLPVSKSGTDATNKYLYKWKRKTTSNRLDYGPRMYMPGIGRCGVVDPLAQWWNSYQEFKKAQK